MAVADAEFTWARQAIEDSRGGFVSVGEDDHDFAPLPCCEFCGTEEGTLLRAVPMAPLLCLACDMKCLLEMEPRLVLNVGAVVARAAGKAAV